MFRGRVYHPVMAQSRAGPWALDTHVGNLLPRLTALCSKLQSLLCVVKSRSLFCKGSQFLPLFQPVLVRSPEISSLHSPSVPVMEEDIHLEIVSCGAHFDSTSSPTLPLPPGTLLPHRCDLILLISCYSGSRLASIET